LVGWVGSFLFTFTFRFLRMRTGGYHAKTPKGCFVSSVCTMLLSLLVVQKIHGYAAFLLFSIPSAIAILLLAPANNAELHLSPKEIAALRPVIFARLLFALIIGAILLCYHTTSACCLAISLTAVAAQLVLSNYGVGVQ
ncbi:MAG: accessory gene regulator B family protein, partial [Gemmiger sp.]|nr:accessory gene regulator B family protein [Gemmiger sp.]